jgi:7-cyano-7-deazaguanine reductase
MRRGRLLSEHELIAIKTNMLAHIITLLEDALTKGMLPDIDTFPSPFTGEKAQTGVIRIIFPEFTCLCPKTGYPDFASIDLYYLPDKVCLELKSWKLYLNSFRMIGTFHETITSFLFAAIKTILKPQWALLAGDFFPRGNVNTTIVFETEGKRPTVADVLLKDYSPHCRTFS